MMRIIAITFLSFNILFSQQSKGKIEGKVIDAKLKDGLPGVNVIVKGTYYGAATDFNGKFSITNVTPGNYIVEFSLIGYKKVQYTGVKVEAGKTTFLEVALEETSLTIEQDIVVIGDKPLLQADETQSLKTIRKEDIEALKVENIKDIVAQQAGIVKSDEALHIRGGRAYENAFLVDGISVQDPLAGTGFGLQLSSNSVEEMEVITGGFNAEFGQATSGVVNVRTREGGEKYKGFFSYKTDKIFGENSYHVFNTEVYEANLCGPEPITRFILPSMGLKLPGEMFFFGNFFAGLTDGITQGYYKGKAKKIYSSTFYGTRFAPKSENSWYWSGKLTYKFSPTMKLSYSYNQSVNINQNSQSLQSNLEYVEPSPGYQYNFQYLLDNANVFTHNNKYHTINWTHTINKKNFYEIKLSKFFTNLRADANGKYWYEYKEPLDIANFPVQYYNLQKDTIGVIQGDGFWDVGNPFTWRDHYMESYTFKADFTSFIDEKNKFKSGIDLTFSEMQVIDIYKPWIGTMGLNNDLYKVHPSTGAFYAQNNITFSGMILNFGLRFDFWFPGKFVDKAIDNPDVITIPNEIRVKYKKNTYSFLGIARYKARLSPRVGISHPVTDNQVLFFSYGHFSKWPKPQFVYAKLTPTSAQSSFQKFGNPNLNPETTVAYEIGIKNQFTPNDVLTITAYYKDIFDYIKTRTAAIRNARFATQSFITYVNQDYARARGIEIEFKKREGRWFNLNSYFSYALVTTKSSTADEGVLVLQGDLEESLKESYAPWDRPFTFQTNLNFYIEKNKALFNLGNGVLDDYNINLKIFYQSGKRYTPAIFTGNYLSDGRPEYVTDYKNRYGKIAKDWFWVDLNFDKNIKIGKTNITLFVEINNLFDNKNSAIINPVTGRAYEYGDPTPSSWNDPLYPDLQPPISPYPFNPARYLTKRNARVGINYKF